jgi:putative hydrolase of the HAD superfamily
MEWFPREGSMAVQAIVFDFGNVIGLFSHRRSAEQLAVYTDLPARHIFETVYQGALLHDYETGRLSSAEFLTRIRSELRLRGSDEELIRAYADMFEPNPEVVGLLPGLAGRYRLLLLSNTNELHYRQFREQFAPFLRWFDRLVLSHEVGVRKPDPLIYRHCEGLAGARAEDCLFIDDLPANVEAARSAGWQGIVYQPGRLREQLNALGVRPDASTNG